MSKVAPFPHRYTVTLSDGLLAAPPRSPIAAGTPPQFGGTDRVWSPEELLVGSVLECLWTTFQAYASHDALDVRVWSGSGTATLEKGAPVPTFSAIALSVDLVVASADIERARRLLDAAEKRCIISNALKVPVTLEARVTGT